MASHFDALVFDMDGVLLQSNHIKHRAMLALFDGDAPTREAIDHYNRSTGGVPRKQKFAHIWTQILHRTYDAEVEGRLAKAYEDALENSLLDAPLVEGVAKFLAECAIPCFVCTAAPEDEAARLLARAGLLGLFRGVCGASMSKAQALTAVTSHIGCDVERVLFFGDSSADLEAARSAGTRFVGVTREKSDFTGDSIPTIFSFEDRHALASAMNRAAVLVSTCSTATR